MRATLTLLQAAQLGLRYMETELECWLESSCLLDDDLRPIRSTLEAAQEEGVCELEEQIAQVRLAIEMAGGAS